MAKNSTEIAKGKAIRKAMGVVDHAKAARTARPLSAAGVTGSEHLEFSRETGRPLEYDPEIANYSAGARPETGTAKDTAQVLEELQAQLAEGNLNESQLEVLLSDPVTFLHGRTDAAGVQAIIETIAKLYFATLHKRAVEGEAFTEARLRQALMEARTRTLEALATHVQSATLEQTFKIAELVSKD